MKQTGYWTLAAKRHIDNAYALMESGNYASARTELDDALLCAWCAEDVIVETQSAVREFSTYNEYRVHTYRDDALDNALAALACARVCSITDGEIDQDLAEYNRMMVIYLDK